MVDLEADTYGEWPRFAWFNEQLKAGAYPRPSDMQRRFGISRSTAKRSIERFERQLGAPIAYDPSKKGYYYPPGCRAVELPPNWLSDSMSDLLLGAIALLARTVRDSDLLAEPWASLLPGKYACLTDRLVVETLEHHPPLAQDLLLIVEALASERTLSIRYAGKGQKELSERKVEPLVLYQYSGNWYVYAYCRMRRDLRLFALDRIVGEASLGEPFDRADRVRAEDPRERLQSAFGLYKREHREWARIRFSPLLSTWVRDQIWHAEQTLTLSPDGSVEVRLPFAGEGIDLIREVLKYGYDAELLEPGWLRDEVRRRLVAATALYAQG